MRRRRRATGFWGEVIALVRRLPDDQLLRLVARHVRDEPVNGEIARAVLIVQAQILRERGAPPWVGQGHSDAREHEFPLERAPDTSTQPHPPRPVFTATPLPSPFPSAPVARCEEGATPTFERLTPTIRRPSMDTLSSSWVRPRPLHVPEEHTEPVRLNILQIPDVRRNRDVFRCDVFEAHIRARTCLARQYTAQELETCGRGAARQRLGPKTPVQACLNCPVGKQIQKQVVAVDKGDVMKRVVKVRDGRLPKRYASGPDRD